jgi:hypothetical protein
MNAVHQVRWDRCIDAGGGILRLYGWVDRVDDHADFVILDALHSIYGLSFLFATSSPDPSISAEMAVAIGISFDDHVSCQRIEQVFGGAVVNAIKLGGTS